MLILNPKIICEVCKDTINLHKPKRMFYLLLCILSSAAVLITFKLLNRFSVNNFSAIIINYLAASIAGFFCLRSKCHTGLQQLGILPWLLMAGMGILFITMFHFLGKSTQTAGVAITSVASKMSVIIPILVSIAIDPNDKLTPLRAVGIILALLAVLLIIIPKKTEKINPFRNYLPLIIFWASAWSIPQLKLHSSSLLPKS